MERENRNQPEVGKSVTEEGKAIENKIVDDKAIAGKIVEYKSVESKISGNNFGESRTDESGAADSMFAEDSGNNKFGKTSRVHLETEFRDGKTVLSDVSFTAPFKVMVPFYPTPDLMQVMILSASAGIMEGDEQEFDIHVRERTSMEYRSQAYEKIHKMKEGQARRRTQVRVEPGAYLKYAPLPTIPFKDSAFENCLEIDLADGTSRLLFQEILTCGRAARGEAFAYRFFHNRVTVRRAGELIYRDNTRYEPALFEMAGLGMYEGHTHLLNLVFFGIPKSEDWMLRAREYLDSLEGIEGGVTQGTGGDIVVRVLGPTSEKLLKISEALQKME